MPLPHGYTGERHKKALGEKVGNVLVRRGGRGEREKERKMGKNTQIPVTARTTFEAIEEGGVPGIRNRKRSRTKPPLMTKTCLGIEP